MLASVSGFQMMQFGQIVLIHDLKDSPLFLGLLGLAAGIPAIILNPLGGVYADRWDKRRLIVICQAITAGLLLVLATLTLLKMVEVWHSLTIAFLVGAVEAFDQAARRANLKLFQDAFAGDERFLIQRENGQSSSFCFPIIVRPGCGLERADVFAPLKDAGIGFRMVTGGCFPRHDAIKYFDYDIVGDLANADIVHDCGFFVGNHPFDLSHQIETLRDVLNGL
mgnify:CR=1 FL=1